MNQLDSRDYPQLDDLIDGHFDGALNVDQAAQLNASLARNPANALRFVERARIEACLIENVCARETADAAGQNARMLVASQPAFGPLSAVSRYGLRQRAFSTRWKFALAAAACLLFALLVRPRQTPPTAVPPVVATPAMEWTGQSDAGGPSPLNWSKLAVPRGSRVLAASIEAKRDDGSISVAFHEAEAGLTPLLVIGGGLARADLPPTDLIVIQNWINGPRSSPLTMRFAGATELASVHLRVTYMTINRDELPSGG